MIKRILLFLCLGLILQLSAQEPERPNILMIICDDLNYLGMGSIVDSLVYCPNIDSLHSESQVFTNAHANVAGCGPSRASMFSGILPQNSGHSGYKMSQNSWLDNPILSETSSVFKEFLDSGYKVYGAGKVYHAYRLREEDFTEYYSEPLQGPFASEKRNHSDMPASFSEFGLSFARLENVPSYPEFSGWQNRDGTPFFFESNENRALLGDEQTVQYCIQKMEEHVESGEDAPLFLSAGLYKPHQPFHVPGKFWDLYEEEDFDLEFLRPDTIPQSLTSLTNRYNAHSNTAYDRMRDESPIDDEDYFFRQYIHGFYASVSFLDQQVGLLMEALEANGLAENTIVIFTSDHGFHLGSKGMVEKSTLWNDATAIPFSVKIPDLPSKLINEPISLIDLYPTLLEFGQVPHPDHELDGRPVQDIIYNDEKGMALVYGISREALDDGELSNPEHSHNGILKGDFKYILYSSGEDELYNIVEDFRELNDLSSNSDFQGIRASMKAILQNEISGIETPTQDFNMLYYGDFNQELNGWGPSDTDEDFLIREGNDSIPSRHLVIRETANKAIRNDNLDLRFSGEYDLKFECAGAGCAGDVTVRITAENIILLDTNIAVTEEYDSYTMSFAVEENEIPELSTCSFFLRSNLDCDLVLDKISIENVDLREDAAIPCMVSSEIQSNVRLGQLQVRDLKSISDQNKVVCRTEDQTGLEPQIWHSFTPTTPNGVIISYAPQEDPSIELYDDCQLELSPFMCSNSSSNPTEAFYTENLLPNTTHYARIAINPDTFDSESYEAYNLFYDDPLARFSELENGILGSNDHLELEYQPIFSLPISGVSFRFVNLDNPQTVVSLKDFRDSRVYPLSEFPFLNEGQSYSVSVSYRINLLQLEVPRGPATTFTFNSATETSEITHNVSPNPINFGQSTLSVTVNNTENSPMSSIFEVRDLSGKALVSRKISLGQGATQIPINLDLPSGVYISSIISDGAQSNADLLFVE